MADDTDEGDNEISPEEQSILLEFQVSIPIGLVLFYLSKAFRLICRILLKDITGIDDLDECKRHLTRHRWDLQVHVA